MADKTLENILESFNLNRSSEGLLLALSELLKELTVLWPDIKNSDRDNVVKGLGRVIDEFMKWAGKILPRDFSQDFYDGIPEYYDGGSIGKTKSVMDFVEELTSILGFDSGLNDLLSRLSMGSPHDVRLQAIREATGQTDMRIIIKLVDLSSPVPEPSKAGHRFAEQPWEIFQAALPVVNEMFQPPLNDEKLKYMIRELFCSKYYSGDGLLNGSRLTGHVRISSFHLHEMFRNKLLKVNNDRVFRECSCVFAVHASAWKTIWDDVNNDILDMDYNANSFLYDKEKSLIEIIEFIKHLIDNG